MLQRGFIGMILKKFSSRARVLPSSERVQGEGHNFLPYYNTNRMPSPVHILLYLYYVLVILRRLYLYGQKEESVCFLI